MTTAIDLSQLQIVFYPHPVLQRKSKPIKRVDAQLRSIVRRMFDLMYEAQGIGLAANQVALPFRLFVVNLKADPNEAEEHVFINPVLSRPKGMEECEEGCLSLPELMRPVKRPKSIRITAYGMDGKEIVADLDGLMARVVQHENDHLDGVVFPDRLSEASLLDAAPELDVFRTEFDSRRRLGQIPSDEEIEAQMIDWEQRYC